MSIETWSDSILVVELQNDPGLTDDMTALLEQLEAKGGVDVLLSIRGMD